MVYEEYFAALVELFRPLHRKGPGSDEFSREVRETLSLPDEPWIVDLGCGTGAGTFILAERYNSPIYSLDLSRDYVQELERTAEEKGYGNIQTVVANMDNPPIPEASFDLIWCDCSIYITGFARALAGWKRLLKPGGLIVASDVIWKTKAPSKECRRFWKTEYPDMSTVKSRTLLAETLGYRMEAALPMPRNCWWESFYLPLEQRLDALEHQENLSTLMKAVIESTRKEIQIFKQYKEEYGGCFFIMKLL